MIVEILEDIKTYGRNVRLYACKGEKLEVLSQRGDVLIIKGKKENFPCQKSKVKKEELKQQQIF